MKYSIAIDLKMFVVCRLGAALGHEVAQLEMKGKQKAVSKLNHVQSCHKLCSNVNKGIYLCCVVKSWYTVFDSSTICVYMRAL